MIKEVVKSVQRSVSQLAHQVDKSNVSELISMGKHRDDDIDTNTVEFSSPTLQVSEDVIQGYLRKATQSKSKIVNSFPARYYQLRRDTGQLKIYQFATT